MSDGVQAGGLVASVEIAEHDRLVGGGAVGAEGEMLLLADRLRAHRSPWPCRHARRLD